MNNYGWGYQPYYNNQSFMSGFSQNGYGMRNDQTQTGDNRIWVQGEIGAKSYIIAPGNTVPLWDSESQTIWIKSVAPNGVPAMQKINYSFEQQPTPQPTPAPVPQNNNYVTREEFEKRLAEIVKPKGETHDDEQ